MAAVIKRWLPVLTWLTCFYSYTVFYMNHFFLFRFSNVGESVKCADILCSLNGPSVNYGQNDQKIS